MPTRYFRAQFLFFIISGIAVVSGCNAHSGTQNTKKDSITSHVQPPGLTFSRPLQIGDKIELSGGYEYDPIYLKNPPASKRSGTVIKFIQGQQEDSAAVVKLNLKISGQKISGDIVVLELRHAGQTWREPSPVHIELCDFMPENIEWKNRKQGEWIEAAAILKLISAEK